RLLVIALTVSLASLHTAIAEVHVRGYFRSNGTYVAPHYRSNPDGNFWNNWSTKGNVNPHTGKPGTRVTPPSRQSSSRSTSSRASAFSFESSLLGRSLSRGATEVAPMSEVELATTEMRVRDDAETKRAELAKAYTEALALASKSAKSNSEQRRRAFLEELNAE